MLSASLNKTFPSFLLNKYIYSSTAWPWCRLTMGVSFSQVSSHYRWPDAQRSSMPIQTTPSTSSTSNNSPSSLLTSETRSRPPTSRREWGLGEFVSHAVWVCQMAGFLKQLHSFSKTKNKQCIEKMKCALYCGIYCKRFIITHSGWVSHVSNGRILF